MENLLLAASLLTDPICRAREKYWLGRALGDVPYTQTFLLYTVGFFPAVLGVMVRFIAKRFQKSVYLYKQGASEEVDIGEKISLLSWNICAIPAGFSITDGGVFPWKNRMHAIVQKILEQDTTIVSLFEVFDIQTVRILHESLKGSYRHFYYGMGTMTLGVASGFFIASKTALKDFDFTRFPQGHLVGRTKNTGKGVCSFNILSREHGTMHFFLTHLQHSEECEFPTTEEVSARNHQMEALLNKINTAHSHRAVVTGDLNLDEYEMHAAAWNTLFSRGVFPNKKTWGGDEFGAKLVGKKGSSARTYDYTMVYNPSDLTLTSSYIETGYDPKNFKQEALSDHLGIVSTISIKD